MSAEKTFKSLMTGLNDASIRFDDLCLLLETMGFRKRVNGSHHLFRKDGVEEMINLQRDGKIAKHYQARQVRGVILKMKLGNWHV